MLYSHKHQLKKLRESGTRAPAKVVDIHLQGTGDMDGLDLKHHPRAHWHDYKLELRVMPEGEEPFNVTVRTRWYSVVGGLWTGSDIEVLYDPAHPRDVVVDYEEAVSRWQAAQEAEVKAVRDGTAPAFDRDAWVALVQEGEEAAENATDLCGGFNGQPHQPGHGRSPVGARQADSSDHARPDRCQLLTINRRPTPFLRQAPWTRNGVQVRNSRHS